jgi:hypothetical protein
MAGFFRLVAAVAAALGLGHAPPTPHLGHGVRSIDIHGAVGVTHVTYGYEVRPIVRLFDRLPRFTPRPCPLLRHEPPDVRFVFRDKRGRVLLRAVDHTPGVCGSSISSSNTGQVLYAPLADNGFAQNVSDLLNVSFDADPAKTAANKRAAKRDEKTLLHWLVLPPGSRRLIRHATSGVWESPLPLQTVDAFEKAHFPRGATSPTSGESGRFGVLTEMDITFSFPVRGRPGIASGSVEVGMTPLRNGGTKIAATAWDGWVIARAAAEVVPVGVRAIAIWKGKRLVHHVTDHRDVATIARWFNRLPLSPLAGHVICSGMALRGRPEKLEFLDGSGNELLTVHAAAYAMFTSECHPLDVSVGGRDYTPLLGGDFLHRVGRLAR